MSDNNESGLPEISLPGASSNDQVNDMDFIALEQRKGVFMMLLLAFLARLTSRSLSSARKNLKSRNHKTPTVILQFWTIRAQRIWRIFDLPLLFAFQLFAFSAKRY
ncbi:hypothetical protein TWF102_002696 [Orbilia oligospora]|uniref:Uncharacterized protein n=1 Tax=Orbilia oligospora TaxID=2813651 RepID=A0A7C8NSF2_ORBOL|nr:hypothetical protein TWF102_002696 [Orbilia oligospora]KAF3116150.1 hypothetical protein TWF103_009376 [Orbilia oligospora]KAF3137858.1 hypothetical protein TWF703_004828 [Orbilia oligospora]KAF3146254.1 hypothetical protein TWF594_003571 [Orbilia oligospora]